MTTSHFKSLASTLLAGLAAIALSPASQASFFFEANLTNWMNLAGAPATRANLFDYLPYSFPTQEVPGTIFSNLGVNLSASSPLIADNIPTTGNWWITTAVPAASIEIRFDTPQTAIYLNASSIMPNGNSYLNSATKQFYAGNTLIASTTTTGNGIISTVAIDRVVVTPNDPANRAYIGPQFYFVPAPGALGLLAVVPMLGGRRRRRQEHPRHARTTNGPAARPSRH
jgi:hypothetical protein